MRVSNRLTYLLHVSLVLWHSTAVFIAGAVIGFAVWYQRHER